MARWLSVGWLISKLPIGMIIRKLFGGGPEQPGGGSNIIAQFLDLVGTDKMEIPVEEDGDYELEIWETEGCGGAGGPGTSTGCRGPSVKMRTMVDASAIVPPPGTPTRPVDPDTGEPIVSHGDQPPGPGDTSVGLRFNPSTMQDPCCGTTESKIEVLLMPLSEAPGPQ